MTSFTCLDLIGNQLEVIHAIHVTLNHPVVKLFRHLASACGILLLILPAVGQGTKPAGSSGFETNRSKLPAFFDKEGRITPQGYRFTTKAYNREALRLVIEEANKAARDLRLPEILPITEASLTRAIIPGYGQSLAHRGAVGAVDTKDYAYFVSLDHKLSYVEGAHQEEDGLKWYDEYKWPISKIDTNRPYELATQWLNAVQMDVKALNRACSVAVDVEPYWNKTLLPIGKFVPIYFVHWRTPENMVKGGSAAAVKLFLPTSTLISLRVEDPRFILRQPLVFTNLDALLSEAK